MLVKDDASSVAFFDSSININLGDGNSVLLWLDPWIHGRRVLEVAPDLLANVPKRHRASRTMASIAQSLAWISDISAPCTISVMLQYLELC
jgi:hypothetical protein